jgi:succinate dehydrogenase / fumarate reductase, membrane anchor subunit
MAGYSRSGRVKPQTGGFELAIWYLMRLSGIGLFVLVLSHYLIMHVLNDPADQDSIWIALRWSSTFWRGFDWLMLMLVLFHAFMGMRVVISDMTNGGLRTFLLSSIYVLAVLLFVLGTIVVMTLPAADVIPAG